ncbi:MAG: hypothetical protein IJU54_02560 [Alphaproteobacteria bacterium]|nr:hypothetical protein [Alphaproteobacteria bacterium]
MYSAPAGYEINIVNYCDQYRIASNPIFRYLRTNRIEDNKGNDCYLNIMLFLKNSMVQFRKNFEASMNMNRAEKVML